MKKGAVIWLNGLAGAGKTSFASKLYTRLKQDFNNVVLLDGDVFRGIFGESKDFSLAGRLKVARKISALCSFLASNEIYVVCATISLFDEIYALNRQNIKNYFEVFVKCEMQELIRRDQKGLYSGALKGEIKNVMGVDLAFNEPRAHFVLENNEASELEAKSKRLFEAVMHFLREPEEAGDKKYWQNYYKTHAKAGAESLFARFVSKHLKPHASLVELGCGNGRDALYFAKQGFKVLAIDQCDEMIKALDKEHGGGDLRFLSADFTRLEELARGGGIENLGFKGGLDCVYSRFTLHSVTQEGEQRVLKWALKHLKKGGLLCIEARGKKNALYKMGVPVSGQTDAFIYEDHFRRFLDFDTLLQGLEKDFEIVFAKEDRDFAPFKEENDYFIRVVARRLYGGEVG